MRIISAAPSTTEILYALELGDSIVAVTKGCDYPAEALSKPKIGGWLDITYEKLKQFTPDIVVTSTFVQEKAVRELEKNNIKVVHIEPVTLNQVYDSIRKIAAVTSTEQKAENIINEMKQGFQQIQEARGIPKQRPRVYCEEWNDPPTGSGNWIPELIEFAGGVSFSPAGTHSNPLEEQELFAWQPDKIILSWCGFGEKSISDAIKQRPGWNALKAIQDNKIFTIHDSLLNRSGPRLVEGARELARIINKNS